jgi:hypothetical protein
MNGSISLPRKRSVGSASLGVKTGSTGQSGSRRPGPVIRQNQFVARKRPLALTTRLPRAETPQSLSNHGKQQARCADDASVKQPEICGRPMIIETAKAAANQATKENGKKIDANHHGLHGRRCHPREQRYRHGLHVQVTKTFTHTGAHDPQQWNSMWGAEDQCLERITGREGPHDQTAERQLADFIWFSPRGGEPSPVEAI